MGNDGEKWIDVESDYVDRGVLTVLDPGDTVECVYFHSVWDQETEFGKQDFHTFKCTDGKFEGNFTVPGSGLLTSMIEKLKSGIAIRLIREKDKYIGKRRGDNQEMWQKIYRIQVASGTKLQQIKRPF